MNTVRYIVDRILLNRKVWIAVMGTLAFVAIIIGIVELTRTDEERMLRRWGVKVEGIRQTAGGYMLDFRYRIVDPDKAVPLVDRRIKPYLIDEKSSATLTVPVPAKVGPMRATTRVGKPIVDRTYFIFFANPGHLVEPGDNVTVAIGDFRAEDLTVE